MQSEILEGQQRCLVLEDFSADYPKLCSNHLILDCPGAAAKPLTEYPLAYDIFCAADPYSIGNGMVLLTYDSCL